MRDLKYRLAATLFVWRCYAEEYLERLQKELRERLIP